MKDFIYLGHLSVEKWQQIEYNFMFLEIDSAQQGLNFSSITTMGDLEIVVCAPCIAGGPMTHPEKWHQPWIMLILSIPTVRQRPATAADSNGKWKWHEPHVRDIPAKKHDRFV